MIAEELVVSHLSLSIPWFVPLAYFAGTLTLRWLLSRVLSDTAPKLEWNESASFDARFSVLQSKIIFMQTSVFALDLLTMFSNFLMFSLCWDLSVAWMAVFLCCSVAVGFFSMLVSIRRMVDLADVGLTEIFKSYLLYFPGSVTPIALIIVTSVTYPYSAYALVILFLLRKRIPKHSLVRLLVRLGICSPATKELEDMVGDAAEALRIEPARCVIAEIPLATAFAKGDRDFVTLSRPILSVLKTAELRQSIVDHEVAHIAQYRRARPVHDFFAQYLIFGPLLIGATVITHMTILPSWPLSKIPELVACILVFLIGILVNLGRLRHRERPLHGLLSTKEQLKRRHSNSKDKEDEADEFARNRVGSETYGEALRLLLDSEGENTDERHVFGYPAFEKRAGDEEPEEDKVLTELDSLQEETIRLSQLFKILLSALGSIIMGLAFYFLPIIWSPLSCFETVLPRTKASPVVALLIDKVGYADEARTLLKASDQDNNIDLLLSRLVLEKKKEENLRIRARIVELSDQHLLLGERAKEIISNLKN
jgi:hypothetical protein